MRIKNFLLISLIFVSYSALFAQDNPEAYEKENLKIYRYKKHQSEIGVHVGHFFVSGDVVPRPGWGAGIHFRRALDFAFSYRFELLYGQAFGLEPRNSTHIADALPDILGTNSLGYGSGTGLPWIHSFKTNFYSASVQGIWNLNVFNFKQRKRKWNFYLMLGGGADIMETYYDATDENGNPYDFNRVLENRNPENNADDRKDIRSEVKNDILDGDYETRGDVATGRRPGETDVSNDDVPTQINLHLNTGGGLSYRLNEKVNLTLEHQVISIFGREGDLLDGYRWATDGGLTQSKDLINYTNLRVNIAIGKKKEGVLPPLYWVSPLDLLADDMLETTQRVDKGLRDSDGDGVLDLVDQEEDTPEGVDVNTKGIALDSDKDGIPNHKDAEPFSPAGFEVNERGVAQVPDPGYTTEDDVNRIVDEKLEAFRKNLPDPTVNWYFPLVNFDNDSYSVRRSEFGKLHQVAAVLEQNPDMRILVTGYADRPASDCYNQVLSFNRAESVVNYLVAKYELERTRLVLDYSGEEINIEDTKGSSSLNRRVEFRVATPSETINKSAPDCGVKKAGKGKKTNYSGNRQGF